MPFDNLKFRYPWRPYQQRVLNAINEHLDDQRLHVVAAPGAGKTSLGLEVFRLLGKTTLVLSPTRIIRDQWLQRLEDFEPNGQSSSSSWTSTSIDTPATLTSITYQAIHSKSARNALDIEASDDELDDSLPRLKKSDQAALISVLKEHNIGVIILDEAHHLTAEWWRALDKVVSSIPSLVLVSLTATPPYDSELQEWNNYEQLCGPIDEEISIPELVKAETLCPHQDYVWAVNASQTEHEAVYQHDFAVSDLLNRLVSDTRFIDIVLTHPLLHSETRERLTIIEPKLAFALLAFLKHLNLPLPHQLTKQLDVSAEDIPELGRKHWQAILDTLFFDKAFNTSPGQSDYLETLKRQLRASELLINKHLSIISSKRLDRSMALSTSKVLGCCDIHKLELAERGEELNQVILTDYIRDEALRGDVSGDLNLGAYPIFQALIDSSAVSQHIALLTGRLCILHEVLLPKLNEYINLDELNISPALDSPCYVHIQSSNKAITNAFTELLKQGDIKVLVGTRSLLGEGWDCPTINSLILASSVGSFMITNQMRGRAIRIDKNNPNKIASIWHLVAIDPEVPGWGYVDFQRLENRFKTFVGLSETDSAIENGLVRLDLTEITKDADTFHDPIAENNRQNIERYKNMAQTRERWQEALFTNSPMGRVSPSVVATKAERYQLFNLKETDSQLNRNLTTLISAIVVYCAIFYFIPEVLTRTFCILIILYTLFRNRKTIKLGLQSFNSKPPIGKAVHKVANTLLEALCHTRLVNTPYHKLRLVVRKVGEDSHVVALLGGTFYESSLYADAFAELVSHVDNPR